MSNTFGFEEALKLMKKGKMVRRVEWGGGDCALTASGGFFKRTPNAANTVTLRTSDVLAEDWELVPETFDFMEALKKLQEGRKVRRWDWVANEYWEIGASGHVYIQPAGEKIVLHTSILKATNWVIYEGSENE